MKLSMPNNAKLVRSALIGLGGVLVVIGLKLLFPAFNWAQTETAVLTAVSAWLVNTVRESLK